VRIVDFGNSLAGILKKLLKNRMQYGEPFHRTIYKEAAKKNPEYYKHYHLAITEDMPEDYMEISFICLREDYLALVITTVDIVNGAAYLFDKAPDMDNQHWKADLEIGQFQKALIKYQH
jgi:integrase